MALRELSISNFAIIDSIQIEVEDGVTMVTGETGAGKSIILDAMNLLLGARAENNLIRHGEDRCDLSAIFDVSRLKNVQTWLDKNELLDDADSTSEVFVRRVLRRDKPTRCFINNQSVPLQSLKQLGLLLVDIHGQHEHQSLTNANHQRAMIDEIARHDDKLANLASIATELRGKIAEIEAISQNNSDNSQRIALIEFQLNEFEELDLSEGEFAELEQEFQRLDNAEQLINGINESLAELFENESANAETLLGKSLNQLEQLKVHDSNLNEPSDLLQTALAQVQEVKSGLSGALASIEHNPERLSEVQQRLDSIINLARKHQCNEADLDNKFNQLQSELESLKTDDQRPEILEKEITQLKGDYNELAQAISQTRHLIATQLSEKITSQMQEVGMKGGEFEVRITRLNSDDDGFSYRNHGLDDIEFMVSANPGLPKSPLRKTASGGELSRISLAIQVVISAQSATPLLVFDEVDSGVGGKTASVVGQKLRQLGKNAQVICITHLPQVASQGHHHWAIEKNTRDGMTFSSIKPLDDKQRTLELARMLGGAELTERTIAHAEEMRALAN